MRPWMLYVVSGLALFAIGLRALFAGRHWLRAILATNLAASGVFLGLVALARRAPDAAPDPVPHALVLTGIVVSVSATALALALARRLAEREVDHGAGEGAGQGDGAGDGEGVHAAERPFDGAP